MYVFIYPSLIYSYDIETDIESNGIEIYSNAIIYENYLYFGFGIPGTSGHYLTRLDTTSIDRTRNQNEAQYIKPEIVWTPESGRPVWAKPIVKDNIIYTLTFVGFDDNPIELAGIDMDTKTKVFHKWIDYDDGGERNSLTICNDIIYILGSDSFSAYNLKTTEQVFVKIFSEKIPEKERYRAGGSVVITDYDEKFYYTSTVSRRLNDTDELRNIFCVDANTGNLLWNDIAPQSESLGTNPIIYNNKMYVPHGYGLRVYNPKTGKLIGVDKSFDGFGHGRNLLYNNYMITIRRNNNGVGKVVAVDVGG